MLVACGFCVPTSRTCRPRITHIVAVRTSVDAGNVSPRAVTRTPSRGPLLLKTIPSIDFQSTSSSGPSSILQHSIRTSRQLARRTTYPFEMIFVTARHQGFHGEDQKESRPAVRQHGLVVKHAECDKLDETTSVPSESIDSAALNEASAESALRPRSSVFHCDVNRDRTALNDPQTPNRTCVDNTSRGEMII